MLGSGSAGNATIVKTDEMHILVDAGLSARQLLARAKQQGIEKFDAVLLTHEHSDHVKGLGVFLKSHPVPVYTTAQTAYILRQSGIAADWKTFEAGQRFSLGSFEIQSFSILHDAVDPVGYVLAHGTEKLGVLSDVGHVTHAVTAALRELSVLFVEANYDDELLMADTKRPWSIKQRISSRHGHLSNRQVVSLLEEIAHPALKKVILGHLSADCNSEDVAIAMIRRALQSRSCGHVEIHCAAASEPRGWW